MCPPFPCKTATWAKTPSAGLSIWPSSPVSCWVGFPVAGRSSCGLRSAAADKPGGCELGEGGFAAVGIAQVMVSVAAVDFALVESCGARGDDDAGEVFGVALGLGLGEVTDYALHHGGAVLQIGGGALDRGGADLAGLLGVLKDCHSSSSNTRASRNRRPELLSQVVISP